MEKKKNQQKKNIYVTSLIRKNSLTFKPAFSLAHLNIATRTALWFLSIKKKKRKPTWTGIHIFS